MSRNYFEVAYSNSNLIRCGSREIEISEQTFALVWLLNTTHFFNHSP